MFTDLVPQAMLMELCQSLRNSSVPNEEQQDGIREMEECLQKEQSSESLEGGHSQVALVVVKQEVSISLLKTNIIYVLLKLDCM